VAADKSIPFGSEIELVPVLPLHWLAVSRLLGGERHFTVEDRGGKIRGKRIDIFFPKSRGGHQAALRWGARRMRIKINGRLAE
jgi:3D (Asp-Asp-Asp) domain-containing protein